MGEIRIPITLTNAVDEALQRDGRIKPSEVRRTTVEAVVDTGAVRSVIPPHLMKLLGLQSRGKRVAENADGRQESVDITSPVLFEIFQRDTLEEAMVLGDEVLVGQTVLEKLDLLADCANQRLIPNPAHPNQPVSKIR